MQVVELLHTEHYEGQDLHTAKFVSKKVPAGQDTVVSRQEYEESSIYLYPDIHQVHFE